MIHEFLRGFFQSTLVSLSDSMSIRKVLIFTSVFAGSKVVYLRFFQNPWRRGILHRCRWLLSPVTTIAITAALAFAAALHARRPRRSTTGRSFRRPATTPTLHARVAVPQFPGRARQHQSGWRDQPLDPPGYGVIK